MNPLSGLQAAHSVFKTGALPVGQSSVSGGCWRGRTSAPVSQRLRLSKPTHCRSGKHPLFGCASGNRTRDLGIMSPPLYHAELQRVKNRPVLTQVIALRRWVSGSHRLPVRPESLNSFTLFQTRTPRPTRGFLPVSVRVVKSKCCFWHLARRNGAGCELDSRQLPQSGVHPTLARFPVLHGP